MGNGLPINRITTAMLRTIFACALSAWLFYSPESEAQPQAFTRAELGVLPSWCHSTLTFTTMVGTGSAFQGYVSRYGNGWNHAHHYCWALISIMRYDRPGNTGIDRQSFATAALNDMQYVLDNVDPKFVLWPDIIARKTRLLIRERRLEQAMESAEVMLSAYPNRADSHGLKAEVLYEAGRRSDARKVLDDAESKVEDPERLETIRAVLRL